MDISGSRNAIMRAGAEFRKFSNGQPRNPGGGAGLSAAGHRLRGVLLDISRGGLRAVLIMR